jgi:hypothetical protein
LPPANFPEAAANVETVLTGFKEVSSERGLKRKMEFSEVKLARIVQRVLFDKSLMEGRNRLSASIAAHDFADSADDHLLSWTSQLGDSE